MFPDSYMPFYGLEFFQAVEGLPEHIALGYLRVVWHYWTHEHCAGLRDDGEYLRKIARIERDLWEEAQSIIFDNEKFFTIADGKWHQKRALEEWHKAEANYATNVKRAKAGARARWKK